MILAIFGFTSEARGSSREELLQPRGQGRGREELPRARRQRWQPGGATATMRPGAEACRSYPTPEARGSSREELLQPRGQGRQPGGATLRPMSGAVAGRSYPTPEARGSGRSCKKVSDLIAV